MTDYLLPSDEKFVDDIAKTIARKRWERDAGSALQEMMHGRLDLIPEDTVQESIDRVFESLWASPHSVDEEQRDKYREEAKAVISVINLKLLTTA